MFKFIVLASVVVLAACTATGYEQIFAQHPKNDFGSSVNSLIQMHTADADLRLQEISDLLYELQALIDNNQQTADAHIDRVRNQCTADIGSLTDSVTTLQTSLDDANGEQSDLITEQAEKNQQLSEEQANAQSTSDDLTQAQGELTDEETKFSEQKASFDEAIIACEEAIRLLNHMIHGQDTNLVQTSQGVMFTQLSQKFSDVQDSLKFHVKKGGPAVFVQPIIDVLAEVSSSSTLNYERVQQIIELIQTLLARLRQGLQERTQQNTRTVDDLNALISTLTTALNNSNNQIGVLTARLSEIDTRLGELTGVIANLSEFLSAQQQTLAETQANCDEEENIYTTETNQRTANLALLTELINHFESQVSTTVGDVREGQVQN